MSHTNPWQHPAALVGIEHIVSAGDRLTGVLPAADPPSKLAAPRHVYSYTPEPADGGGLYDPYALFRTQGEQLWLMGVHIITPAAVAWSVYLTDGLAAAGDPSVDTASTDVLIVGGSGGAYAPLRMCLVPAQRIRITTGINTDPGLLRAVLFVTAHTGERRLNP